MTGDSGPLDGQPLRFVGGYAWPGGPWVFGGYASVTWPLATLLVGAEELVLSVVRPLRRLVPAVVVRRAGVRTIRDATSYGWMDGLVIRRQPAVADIVFWTCRPGPVIHELVRLGYPVRG